MDLQRRKVIGGIVAFGAVGIGSPSSAAPGADAMLRAADRARYPLASLQLTNRLSEYVDNKLRSKIALTVLAKPDATGRFSSLVRYDEPARDAGKVILFKGADLWFYDPTSKATIRISPQQRLIGQASNGDVVLSNFTADYIASVGGRESTIDADQKAQDCLKLDLRAKATTATYARIELWLVAASNRPIKAKFYSSGNRLLKTAFWRSFAIVLGQARATETVIVDGVNTRLVTTMKLTDIRQREIPDAWFARTALAEASAR